MGVRRVLVKQMFQDGHLCMRESVGSPGIGIIGIKVFNLNNPNTLRHVMMKVAITDDKLQTT